MELVEKESLEMENRSGVEVSLSDEEAKAYLEEVIREIRN